ncbi:MAG: putative cation efflux protein [Thermoleophilia bacterium]|nr:putative cation efflux protein [Thermoleophilia bacterium]
MERSTNRTVLLAFVVNVVVALVKTVAGVVTGSASIVAEAAHSWADTGNQLFLLVADRRSQRPADDEHPFGHGREAYVWSLFAALGLFAVGSLVSIAHGVQELGSDPGEDGHVGVAYAVLGVAALFEGASFLQAFVQVRRRAARGRRGIGGYVLHTSNTTLRAVFFEDAAALGGLLIAFGGVLLAQLTGSSRPDAIGSILVGVLLGAVAVVLVDRNRRFLIGETVDPEVRQRAMDLLLESPEVESVGFLRLEYVGPDEVIVLAAIDLVGNEREHDVARSLRTVAARVERRPEVRRALLTLAMPGAQSDPADRTSS